jgi:hypothetical protein
MPLTSETNQGPVRVVCHDGKRTRRTDKPLAKEPSDNTVPCNPATLAVEVGALPASSERTIMLGRHAFPRYRVPKNRQDGKKAWPL